MARGRRGPGGALGAGGPAFAQNAQIIGTLKDQSGGVLPGVTVTATNQETGLTRTAVTEANGDYRLPALPPGAYTVTAELVGFSTETRPDIVLVIDQTATIDFTLRPAALQETVTVTGESPIVDTTASTSPPRLERTDPGPAGGVAALDRPRDADAGHVAGQHPRLLLSRQRQRRRRRARILERLRRRRRQQHLGRDGRAAPELRDGRDPRVQGLDVELQGRVRPGHRRPADGRDQVGHQRAARVGPAVLPRRVDHRQDRLRDGAAGLPPLSVRRHDRRPDRPEQDALLLRLRGDEGEPVLHRQHRRPVAAIRRHLRQQAGSLDLHRQARSSAQQTARACSCAGRRRTSTGRSSPPAAARRRAPASTSRCRAIRRWSRTPG